MGRNPRRQRAPTTLGDKTSSTEVSSCNEAIPSCSVSSPATSEVEAPPATLEVVQTTPPCEGEVAESSQPSSRNGEWSLMEGDSAANETVTPPIAARSCDIKEATEQTPSGGEGVTEEVPCFVQSATEAPTDSSTPPPAAHGVSTMDAVPDVMREETSAPSPTLPKRLKPGKLIFSFAAAGWLQTYHFGVAKALQELGLDQDAEIQFCGSSAGSLAAAALITKVDFDSLCNYAVDCVTDCRSSPLNAFRIREYVLVGIERFAVDRFRKDAKLREALNKRLEVYVSILPWCRKKVMHRFETAEDLEEALIASCCLVPLAGLPLKLRHSGEWVCDGGLTAFQPRKGEAHVITVSAMYFNRADIRPPNFVPSWWGLYPPDERTYREVFHGGYRDAIEFLVREQYVESSALELLKQPQMSHYLHGKKRGTSTSQSMSWGDVALDIATGIAFMLFIRPWALFIIYGEMFVSSAVLLVVAFADLTKGASWENWYHAVRNILSIRVLLHFLVGKKVPVNLGRLEKHSRVYRILKPLLYG